MSHPRSLSSLLATLAADLMDRVQCLCSSTRHPLAPHEYPAQHRRRSRQLGRLPLLYVDALAMRGDVNLLADKAPLDPISIDNGLYVCTAPVIGRIVDKRGPKPTLVFAAIALTSGCQSIPGLYLFLLLCR
jgi:hypothetical protein